MKYLFAAAVLVAGTFASFSAANAAGGCGPGWHRGPYGGCQPISQAVVVRPAPVVVVRPAPRRRGAARPRVAPTAPCGAMDAAALTEPRKNSTRSPARRGAFLLRRHDGYRRELRNHAEDRTTAHAKQRQGMRVPSLPSQHWLTSSTAAPVTATAAPERQRRRCQPQYLRRRQPQRRRRQPQCRRPQPR